MTYTYLFIDDAVRAFIMQHPTKTSVDLLCESMNTIAKERDIPSEFVYAQALGIDADLNSVNLQLYLQQITTLWHNPLFATLMQFAYRTHGPLAELVKTIPRENQYKEATLHKTHEPIR